MPRLPAISMTMILQSQPFVFERTFSSIDLGLTDLRKTSTRQFQSAPVFSSTEKKMGEHTMPTKMEVSYSLSVAQLPFD
jgi:hypothetical protein